MSTLIKTLYAYSIKHSGATRSTSEFREKLFMLQEDKDKNTIGKRKLKDGDKYDVLLYYDINKATKRCFGVMVKFEYNSIKPPKIIKEIDGEKWNIIENEEKNKDIVKTYHTESTTEIIINDIYYFMVDKNYLVITLPLKRISEFEKYINWIFNDYEYSNEYNFELILHTTKGVKITEPKKGTADNPFFSIIQPQKRFLRRKDEIMNLIRNSTEDRPIEINDESKMVKDLFKTKELSVDTNNLSMDIVEILRKKMNEFLTELKKVI